MSSVGECTLQLFVFPIVFQTVSFHHRATYELKFSLSVPVIRLHPLRQLFSGEQREFIDRNGNAWNIDGHSQKQSLFRTGKFPIEYNDQIVKFKTGFIARANLQQERRVAVRVELIRLPEEEKTQGKGKRVSAEVLQVNLEGGQGSNLRRVVFSTNEYISFVDVAFQFTRLCIPRKEPPQTTQQYYQRAVSDRLEIYRQLAVDTTRKLQQFHEISHNHPSFRHTYSISSLFEAHIVEPQVADLSYVEVELPGEKEKDKANYYLGIEKYDSADACLEAMVGPAEILCEHYQCGPHELTTFIEAEGKLIEANIRSLFQRLAQLTISLSSEEQHLISGSEIARVRGFIVESQRHLRTQKDSICEIPLEIVANHRAKMLDFVRTYSSCTQTELRQPYVEITNEQIRSVGRRESMDGTLTVFIHGYKGNEYDLSKIKSHLMLLLGCNHFYSIKGLAADKANDATINVLGETAAKELLVFLAHSPSFRSINFICFSLGGVIARAMLPWLEQQKARLNLLMTIATPHLGLREVENCLVRAGLCYMRRVAGVESIRELNSQRNCKDSRYLLQLAKGECLQWFRSIVLVGSFEDSYVPAYSSLARYTGDDELTQEMSERLKAGLGRAVRVLAKLDYSQSLLDVITRRRTHISFLEDDSFIKYLMVRLQHLFAHQLPE